jgi:hypothetical protein
MHRVGRPLDAVKRLSNVAEVSEKAGNNFWGVLVSALEGFP